MKNPLLNSVNSKVEQICFAVAAAKKAGLSASVEIAGQNLICNYDGFNRVIGLNLDTAPDRLNSLLNDIYAITPLSVAV